MVKLEIGTGTGLLSGLLCVAGCWLCVCLPCIMPDCKDAIHHCPHCGSIVGRKNFLI